MPVPAPEVLGHSPRVRGGGGSGPWRAANRGCGSVRQPAGFPPGPWAGGVLDPQGRFAGATGGLFDQGTVNLQTGHFVTDSFTGLIQLER